MSTLEISISEQDIQKYGLTKSKLSFKEFLDKINIELARQALYACQDIAEKAGLSRLTIDEINAEIKAVRQNNG